MKIFYSEGGGGHWGVSAGSVIWATKPSNAKPTVSIPIAWLMIAGASKSPPSAVCIVVKASRPAAAQPSAQSRVFLHLGCGFEINLRYDLFQKFMSRI